MPEPMKAAFRDRPDGGRELARLLSAHDTRDALVLAIPSGGVPVAKEIAVELKLPLDVAPVSKLLLPWTTESGFGAVAFDGSIWIDDTARRRWNLSDSQVAAAIAEARAKVERRTARLRGGRAFPSVSGRRVILVDDGIAAGSTMRTAVAALRRLDPARIVVAVPTAHQETLSAIARLADAVVCPDIRAGFRFAVADAYGIWRDLGEDEAAALLAA